MIKLEMVIGMDKTKIRLEKAIKELMTTKTLEKITIGEICEKAMLSRQTFYHHFQDKYDLVNWIFDQTFLNTFEKIGHTASWQVNIENFLGELKKQKSFYTPAYHYQGQNSLESHHYKRVYDFYETFYIQQKGKSLTYAERFSLEVYCRGAVFMVAEWGRGGFEESHITMTELFRIAMTDEIQKHLII